MDLFVGKLADTVTRGLRSQANLVIQERVALGVAARASHSAVVEIAQQVKDHAELAYQRCVQAVNENATSIDAQRTRLDAQGAMVLNLEHTVFGSAHDDDNSLQARLTVVENLLLANGRLLDECRMQAAVSFGGVTDLRSCGFWRRVRWLCTGRTG